MSKLRAIGRSIKNAARSVVDFFKKISGQSGSQSPQVPVDTTPTPELPTRDQDSIEGDASCSTDYRKPDWNCLANAIVLDNVNDSRYKNFISRFFQFKESHFEKAALRILKETKGVLWSSDELENLSQLIAALYYREDTTMSFKTALHNGETLASINKYGTSIVPRGLGKGLNWTWDEAAHNAMMIKKSIFPKVWTFGECLAFAEKFNGLGYRSKIGDKGKVELSPYVGAGTTLHDETGKYYADGKYSKTANEAQLGVAALIKRIKIEIKATNN